MRDAANGRIFTERCEAICGAKVEIVSGEEEAVLSYIGASDGGACGMIDIGGGSTEFTLGEDETNPRRGQLADGCSAYERAEADFQNMKIMRRRWSNAGGSIQRDAQRLAGVGDEAGTG